MKYKITAAVDNLDPSPLEIIVDDFYEVQDWVAEEIDKRIKFFVDHSPYMLTEVDLDEQRELEMALISWRAVAPHTWAPHQTTDY